MSRKGQRSWMLPGHFFISCGLSDCLNDVVCGKANSVTH